MTTSPKTRKRILIAMLAVIGLAGGARWLTRPRIDPRFVGKWAAFEADRKRPQAILELRSDGTGTTTDSDGSHLADYRWTCDGDNATFGSFSSNRLVASIENAIERLTGRRYVAVSKAGKVVSITPDEFVVSWPIATMTYRRLPE